MINTAAFVNGGGRESNYISELESDGLHLNDWQPPLGGGKVNREALVVVARL